MDKELRVFVISTIADPKSGRRKHADAVKDLIVDPAAQSLKGAPINSRYPGDGVYDVVRCERGEQVADAKDIMRRIVDDICQAHIIVAVVSEPNLNVFFELGVARSANSPVFVLKERDVEMPFDLRGFPYIEYRKQDLKRGPTSPAIQAAQSLLSTQMRANLDKAMKSPPFDRPELGALGGTAVLDAFVQIPYTDWSRLILGGRKELWIAGLSLWELMRPNNRNFHLPTGTPAQIRDGDGDAHITELMKLALATGVDVTIMIMDADNPALPHYAIQPRRDGVDRSPEMLAVIKDEIAKTTEAVQSRFSDMNLSEVRERYGITAKPGRWRFIPVIDGMIQMRVTMTEYASVTSPFFNTIARSSGGPAIRGERGAAWHTAVNKELELLAARQTDHRDTGWRNVA